MEKRPTVVSWHSLRSQGTSAFFRTFLVVGLLGWFASCGGDSTSGPNPDDTKVSTVSVTPGTNSLTFVGETAQLSAAAKNASGNAVSGTTFQWSSSSSTVATVSGTGLVTAVGNGAATITATANGTTVSSSAQVTVQQAAAEVSVSPAEGELNAGATVQLSATATDAGGAELGSASFTWSSSDDALASVSSDGLVTGKAGGGTVVITATSGGASGSASLAMSWANLEISVDSNLSGTYLVDEFTVAAGVTVTATDDLTIDATGYVEILGTITGDCVAVTVQGDTAVTVMGTVDNGCAAGGDGEDLSIVADGELTFEDATIISSGDIDLSNDPTLVDTDFPESGPSAVSVNGGRGPSRAGPGIPFTRVNRSTFRYHGGATGPSGADDGADNNGGDGGDAKNGRRVAFKLRGNAEFAGNTLMWGQTGGKGGNGSETKNSDVEVSGGNGGNGGDIRVWVTGTLAYLGSENIIRSGSGGLGGNATATAQANAEPSRAPSAKATGGMGGNPGLMDIRAGGGVNVQASGSLVLEIGVTGDGGNGTALAADGFDATASKPAQAGGNAEAKGGDGGATPEKQLAKRGNVTGADPVIRGVESVPMKGGKGGEATATAGDGGDGLKPNKDGAEGGKITAQGGKGGDYELKDLDANLVGDGGDGGMATFRKGNGGDGWDDCEVPGSPEAGGAGGKGGDGAGGDGAGGEGLANGNDGNTQVENAGNGGDGMREQGALGPNGTDGINTKGARTDAGTNFQPGQPGGDCPTVPPVDAYIDLPSLPNNSGVVAFGEYPLDLYDAQDQVVGSMVLRTFGEPNNHFVGQNPWRVGWFGLNGWELLLESITFGGLSAEATEVELCLLNTQVDEQNPAFLEQIDGEGQVIDTQSWTGLAAAPGQDPQLGREGGEDCRVAVVKPGAKIVRGRGPGGRFADGRGPGSRRGPRVRIPPPTLAGG